MEEFQLVRKSQQFPRDIKIRRKVFNNRRFYTQPCQDKNKSFDGSTRKQSPVHQKQKSQRKTTKKKSLQTSQFKLYFRRKNEGKLINFWQQSLSKCSIKTCRVACSGYAKRKQRVKDNLENISYLFQNSTRLSTNKQNLQINIKKMSNVLRNSFPRLQFDHEPTDQNLRLRNDDYRCVLSRREQSYFNQPI